jgi:tubulin polyglutamylase TTLL9
LIDSNFKPWLLEINGSPSLEPSDEDDFHLKAGMIGDAIDIVLPNSVNPPTEENHFELMYVITFYATTIEFDCMTSYNPSRDRLYDIST